MDTSQDMYVSVDIESAGPNPSQYSLLTIGACTLSDRPHTFYVELKPLNDRLTPEAYAIHHLSLKRLSERGKPPAEAMADFERWIKNEACEDCRPVFVAFNAPFEWMFVNDYFHRFLGHNPFGGSALDLNSFYMGLKGVPRQQAGMKEITAFYLKDREFTHHALRDAVDQAEVFARMLAEIRERQGG